MYVFNELPLIMWDYHKVYDYSYRNLYDAACVCAREISTLTYASYYAIDITM